MKSEVNWFCFRGVQRCVMASRTTNTADKELEIVESYYLLTFLLDFLIFLSCQLVPMFWRPTLTIEFNCLFGIHHKSYRSVFSGHFKDEVFADTSFPLIYAFNKRLFLMIIIDCGLDGSLMVLYSQFSCSFPEEWRHFLKTNFFKTLSKCMHMCT